MKNLYFEGAGLVPRGELDNCRIRTAFHLDDGTSVYMELIGWDGPSNQKYKVQMFVDSCFVIYWADGSTLDARPVKTEFRPYTKNAILTLVKEIGGTFDDVIILPPEVYRVHNSKPGKAGYNFMEDLEIS